MRPSPMREEYQRPTNVSPASTNAMTAMSTAVTVTTWAFPGVTPWSMIRRKSSGWATTSTASITRVMRKPMTRTL